MGPEKIPEGGNSKATYFDRLAAQRPHTIVQRMDLYVRSHLVDSSESFGDNKDRIDDVGERLAHQIITDLQPGDIEAIRRGIRFGLQISRILSGDSKGYSAGLDKLEEMLLLPGVAKYFVGDAYERYLSKHPLLDRTLHENLKILAQGCPEECQNVISFIIEEADRETYVDLQSRDLDGQIEKFFDHPSES